ncbi:hypothetical protein Ccrd_019529 [Cynara cardunculus var. scolymus]|uniref:Uncharacterized protein n=1 Tax=Cynara cardunculus var. scolymus TaxID=59895 RepID=A0A103Y461_CYNCS|nr:hypothetical protein Ccrd_019529 [Cynara cardunculus var. scolymus]
MGKLVVSRRSASCFVFLVLVLSAGKVAGRVHYDADAIDQLLLSDGSVSGHEEDSILHDHLKGMDYCEGKSCHQMYGFLPCSTNLPGHIFLIVIYEYLLYCGELCVTRLSHNEAAEEHLAIAVGLFVGSSILLLTLVWGCCIFVGQRKFDDVGSGVVIDAWICLDAQFMLLSLLPFIVILIPMAVGVSSASERFVLSLSLLVAVLCLFTYFFSQSSFGDHFRNENYRSLEYTDIERKMEMHVPFYEVQELMRHRSKHLMSMGMEMEEKIMGRDVTFDFKEWFYQKIHSMDDPYFSYKSNQVARLLLEEKHSLMGLLVDRKVSHDVHTDTEKAIDSLFENIVTDGIEQSELKQYLESQYKPDKPELYKEVVRMIRTYLDATEEDGNVDPKEFKCEMKARLWEIEHYKSPNHPLTHSVQIFSESVNIPPFYISFVFLPLATRYRTALAAIGAAKKKRSRTTSSTFSEIYRQVLMNNLIGFALLLRVMTYRGLTWHFSAEVLTLVIVCGIMGIFASSSSKFPNWTLIIALPLYPLSFIFLILVNAHFR